MTAVADYAHTEYAARNRYDKAKALAKWLWEQGVTAAQLDLWTDDEWARACRAGVGRPASDETRLVVYGLMIVKEAWASAHRSDPAARRRVLSDEQVSALVAPRG